MTVYVTLAGQVMDGSLDSEGVRWFNGDITGYDSPPVRINDSDRTAAHGGYGPERLYASRLLTLPGWCECPSLEAAFSVRERLHSMMSGELIVHEPVPKVLEVVSGGAPRSMEPLDAPTVLVEWQIPLVAHNPFKRALSPAVESIAAGATGSFSATGRFPAELEVTTTSAGTVHIEQGGLAIMAGSVPSGTVFTSGPGFDNLPRSVVGPSGEDLYSLTLPGTQWPAVVPGSNSILNLGTADVQVRYYPTYA